jgi:restriction system protein
MEFPSYDELFNPVLSALHKLGGSGSIEEIYNQVINDLNPPPEFIQRPHGKGSQSEIEYRLAWARTYLKKFGVITNSERGVWVLTPEGMKTKYVDSKEVIRFYQTQTKEPPKPPIEGESSHEVEDQSLDETASWRSVLLETLLNMDPNAFERLCQRLLRESGFIEVEVTGRSGDGGIDGHGVIRIAGMISFTVLFQCKRYRDKIGPNIVRDFRGAMIGRADKGLLITTGGFTREARLEATRDGAPPIDLISGELLIDRLKELNLGVQTERVEVVKVDLDWFKEI